MKHYFSLNTEYSPMLKLFKMNKFKIGTINLNLIPQVQNKIKSTLSEKLIHAENRYSLFQQTKNDFPKI